MDDTEKEQLYGALIEIATEEWRFRRIFGNILSKLDAGNGERYRNHYEWFRKKVESALEIAGLRIENAEGQLYDIGMAATPLNIDDFAPGEQLFVEQMIEPILMKGDKVAKNGTVILGAVK